MLNAKNVRKKDKRKSPSVREGTREMVICTLCRSPIIKGQRPAVQLQAGNEAHMECFNQRELHAAKPN